MRKPLIFLTVILLGTFLFFNTGTARGGGDNIIVVTTSDDVVANDGDCSLREAVHAANLNIPTGGLPGECPAGSAAATDIIQLTTNTTYNLTINGADDDNNWTGDLDFFDNAAALDVALVAVGDSGRAIINAPAGDRHLHFTGGQFVLENLDLRNGAGAFGGAILSLNTELDILNTAFSLNSADVGGGIYSYESAVEIHDSSFARNYSNLGSAGGGAISNYGGSLLIVDTIFNGNESSSGGGALFTTHAGVSLLRVRMSDNSAIGNGGAIYNNEGEGGSMSISESIIERNIAGSSGGGIYSLAELAIMTDSRLEGNLSDEEGAGLYMAGTLTVLDTIFHDNGGEAPEPTTPSGAGLFLAEDSQAFISRAAFTHNRAGAAAAMILGGQVNMSNVTVSNNEQAWFGAVYVAETGSATIYNSTVFDNSAANGDLGAGIFSSGAVSLGNTIVASSLGINCGGNISSAGHNLYGDDTCPSVGSDQIVGDMGLAPLSPAGYHTPTYGSPAINSGDDLLCGEESIVLGVDQIGLARPMFDICDIGAIEWTGLTQSLPIIVKS